MTWGEFNAIVNDLLSVERARLGAEPVLSRWIRLAVGEIQRRITYYRRGIVSTFECDDLSPDGFASRLTLPSGASLRELYHVKTGSGATVRRPMIEYDWSNRHDLIAGVVNFGRCRSHFRYALDPRGGRDCLVYPQVTRGYAVQVVWDAIVGRTTNEYADTDEVPFDEPMADLVYELVKAKLAREVNNELAMARDYERTFQTGISRLYSEVQERLRQKVAESPADCAPCACGNTCDDPVVLRVYGVLTSCSGSITYDVEGCPVIVAPQTEWAMVGDSAEQADLSDVRRVAGAIQAFNPEFVVHLGDAVYPDGAAAGVRDSLLAPYWNFIDEHFYWAPGDKDLLALDNSYGENVIDALPAVSDLIEASDVSARKLWYTFARGVVRFFVINSGTSDADTDIQLAEMADWLQAEMASATESWLVVVFHRPAQTSDVDESPGSAVMQSLALKDWGADLVVSGHAHNYERVLDSDGLLHVVCGLGGAAITDFADQPVDGSQFRANSKHGFLRFTANTDALQFAFQTVDGEILDRVTLVKE